MKEEISAHIQDPDALEKLYRQDPSLFTSCFEDIARDFDTDLVRFWRLRLNEEETGTRERGGERERVRRREGIRE